MIVCRDLSDCPIWAIASCPDVRIAVRGISTYPGVGTRTRLNNRLHLTGPLGLPQLLAQQTSLRPPAASRRHHEAVQQQQQLPGRSTCRYGGPRRAAATALPKELKQ